jgi:alkylated DNA nucleotide flippase Atl1
MKLEIAELTPELAEKLLGSAAPNRHPSYKMVKAYARDMAEGRWTLNGETIKVNRHGQLFDGKHRCLAVVESGITIQAVIVYDAEEDNVDSGRPRSYGDVLAMAGEPNARNYAAVIKAVAAWEEGLRPAGRASGSKVFTFQEKEEIRLKYPEIADTVRVAGMVKAHIPVAPSLLGLCHWLFSRIDPEDAADFMNNLADGVGLDEGNPVLTLRNRIFKDRLSHRGPLHDPDVVALFIMAWNAYREHRSLSRLQLPNPLNQSNFPEPK